MYHDRKWITCDRCGKEIEYRKGILKAKLDRHLWCSLRFYLMKDGREDCADELAELIRTWMKNKNN